MSMSIKMLICLAFFLFIAVAVMWVIQILMSDTLYASVKQREVDKTADLLREILTSDDDEMAERVILDTAEKYGMCIRVYKVDGNTMSEEHFAIALVNSMIENPKEGDIRFFYMQASARGGAYRTRFAVDAFGSQMQTEPSDDEIFAMSELYVEILNEGGDNEQLLIINSLITPFESAKQTIFAQFSYILVFMVIGSLFMALLLSRLISSPLKGISETAKQLADGNYDVEFEGGGYREINELSDTLNYAARELSKNDNLQKELIANISHDLRTPLTMIKGYSEMMRDIPGENTAENIQSIIDETEQLSELVNDLLDLSKIESGAKKFEPAELDLTEAVLSVMSRYEKMKASQGYNLDFEYESNVSVIADRTMILQVIYNLINNAINYCGDDLYVGVKQEIREGSDGSLKVRISVIDHGEGIAESQLPLIWDRYYKIDGVHRRATVGTGIGLSIVKKLLVRHGAAYGVDSKVGEGSVFWFELDVSEK